MVDRSPCSRKGILGPTLHHTTTCISQPTPLSSFLLRLILSVCKCAILSHESLHLHAFAPLATHRPFVLRARAEDAVTKVFSCAAILRSDKNSDHNKIGNQPKTGAHSAATGRLIGALRYLFDLIKIPSGPIHPITPIVWRYCIGTLSYPAAVLLC